MSNIRKIVVPTDFSEGSKVVIRHAAAMASAHGAELLLLHVIPPTLYPTYGVALNRGFPNLADQMQASNQAQLESFRDSLETEIPTRLFVRVGETYRETAQLVDEENADMVAISTHGRTGIKHAIMGSTAEKIVRSATVPVLTVRFDEEDPPVAPEQLTRVVVPTDFSDLSLQAFDFARRLLGPNTDAEIVLAHVFEPPTYPSGPFGIMAVDMGQVEVDLREQASESMRQLVEDRKAQWPHLRGEIREGLADLAICELANECHADLVVMATHGYTGFRHLLLGSVTEKIVRRAECPLVTVHAGGGESTD